MSHHYSGPDASFPHGDTRLDLTDLYAFPKPGSAGKSILIMNVHLSSSIKPPQPTYLDPFAADAFTSLRSTPTAMLLPILPTAYGSRRSQAVRRPQCCAASRARKPPGPAMAGRPSLNTRRFPWSGTHE